MMYRLDFLKCIVACRKVELEFLYQFMNFADRESWAGIRPQAKIELHDKRWRE